MLSSRIQAALGAERKTVALVLAFVLLFALIATSMRNGQKQSAKSLELGDDENGKLSAEYEIDDKLGADAKPTAKSQADELLAKLHERIGKGMGPLIVGGVGDSGTRGVREVLIHFGAQMLGEGYVHHISKDSLVYMAGYSVSTSSGKIVTYNPGSLYKPAIQKVHSLKYNSSVLPPDYWQMGLQYVAKMVDRSMSISLKLRKSGEPLEPWGFKHPRTALLLPFWMAALGDKFVYIHVIRDGKDIIEGANQKVFYDVCALYYGKKCPEGLQSKINFWADLVSSLFFVVGQSD
jgi:hypothetical protein